MSKKKPSAKESSVEELTLSVDHLKDVVKTLIKDANQREARLNQLVEERTQPVRDVQVCTTVQGGRAQTRACPSGYCQSVGVCTLILAAPINTASGLASVTTGTLTQRPTPSSRCSPYNSGWATSRRPPGSGPPCGGAVIPPLVCLLALNSPPAGQSYKLTGCMRLQSTSFPRQQCEWSRRPRCRCSPDVHRGVRRPQ